MRYFISYWVYGGSMAGLLLLGLLPAISNGWTLAVLLIYLQLPVYMLHQLEEHYDDRFHQFAIKTVFGGRDLLTQKDIFIINVPGVWGVNLISILLATQVDIGYGLIAVYMSMVNGFTHLAQGIRLKCYNPGLVTGVFVFIPLGGWAAWKIHQAGGGTPYFQTLGIGCAILIHALIILRVIWVSRHAPFTVAR